MLAIVEARSRTTELGEDLAQSIFSFLQSLLDFNRIDLNQIDFYLLTGQFNTRHCVMLTPHN